MSAGLFFGSLIPLSLKYESGIVLPLVYGIGTALPVIVFAFLLGFSANYVAKFYNKLQVFEKWSRKITGAIFIIAAIYLYQYGISWQLAHNIPDIIIHGIMIITSVLLAIRNDLLV